MFSGALYTSADPRMPALDSVSELFRENSAAPLKHYPGARVCVRMQEDAKFSNNNSQVFSRPELVTHSDSATRNTTEGTQHHKTLIFGFKFRLRRRVTQIQCKFNI